MMLCLLSAQSNPTLPTGSFVPFTIVTGCSTDKAMEKNSGHALDLELAEASEKDWAEFLPKGRIKAGIMEMFLGSIAFPAILACCFR
jgi:hypothetical protein